MGAGACMAVSVLQAETVTRSLLPTARFLLQGKSECHFSSGSEHVRFLAKYIYNQEELVRFDSDEVGEFRAVSELGRPIAEDWNSQQDFIEQKRAAAGTYCRHNYGIFAKFQVQRRGEGGPWTAREREGRQRSKTDGERQRKPGKEEEKGGEKRKQEKERE